MYFVKESENVFNYTPQNQQSHILTLKIMVNFSQIKSSGLLMILMFTELLFIRLLKEILLLNQSMELYLSLILELVSYS